MNIGLVLSGGMAKGAYQIGALRALNNFIPNSEIKYISCASIGVLNGYAYATAGLDKAENIWKNVCDTDSRQIISKILKSSLLQRSITELCEDNKDLSSVFYCSLLDLSRRNVVYKDLSGVDNEKIPLYLKASIAMPIYSKAVNLDNTSYYDGAMVDNIPVYPLLKHNLDYVICMYFDDTCYKFENSNFDAKTIKLAFPSDSVIKQSVILSKGGIEEMIEYGYERTKHLLSLYFCEGYDNLDHIYATINCMNENSKNKRLRITGDVLVTNLNRVTQKLIRRKIL